MKMSRTEQSVKGKLGKLTSPPLGIYSQEEREMRSKSYYIQILRA